MRLVQFLIFFGIVLTIHTLLNYYIFSRGLKTFEPGSVIRKLYIIGFWTLAASFFAGRILEKVYLSHLSDLFTWAGSFWLAAMLYLFLAVLFIDVLRLADKLFPFLHHLQGTILASKPYLLTIGVATAVFLIVLAGHINALNPRTHRLSINVPMDHADRENIRIALVTDVHLGTIVGRSRLEKIVNKINGLHADVILFSGDIVDEDLAPVIRQNLGKTLQQLKAPLGVFGVTGNHEYIGGAEQAVAYLEGHGIKMLRDTVVILYDKVLLGGRDDIQSNRFAGLNRKTLSEISSGIEDDQFLILLDHQPTGIPEAVESEVDLILCGHTHHGQLWPLNYITQAMFAVSWGYKKIKNTHVYVSSGIGSWGPPVRIGNRPELVEITLHFR
jgi:uncharacterized protein